MGSLVLMVPVAQSDILGFSAGVNYLHHDMNGQVRSMVAADGEVEINLNDNSDVSLFIAFEHPVPFLPNVKLQQNNLQASGLIPVADASFLGGQAVLINGDIDLSHTGVVLYYELLDNWLNLDMGLSVKYFDGYSRFNYPSQGFDDTSQFDDWVPMLYAQAQFDLPFTGFSAATTVEALSFDDNHVTDVDLALKYQHKTGLGADLGYRSLDVNLKNSNSFKSDLKSDGFYLGLNYNF